MTDYHARLDTIEAKLDLVIERLSLMAFAVTPQREDEVDGAPIEMDPAPAPPPVSQACPHNQQALNAGRLVCARCGFDFGPTGLGTHQAGSGTREGRR